MLSKGGHRQLGCLGGPVHVYYVLSRCRHPNDDRSCLDYPKDNFRSDIIKIVCEKKFRYVKMPLFFATIFLVIAFSMLSYVIKGQVNTTDIRNGAKEWVQCLAFNFLRGMKNPAVNASAIIPPKLQALGVVPGSGCGVRYPVRLSTFLTHMAQGCVLGQAILVALVFGHSRQNWLLWQRKLGCGRGMKDSDRTASMATTTSGGMHKLSSTKSLLSKMSLSKMSLPKR